jgi:hypothetical protein
MDEWLGALWIPLWVGAYFLYTMNSYERKKFKDAKSYINWAKNLADKNAVREKLELHEKVVNDFDVGTDRFLRILAVFFVFLGFFFGFSE